MKQLLFIISFLFYVSSIQGQIEIKNYSKEIKEKITPYDSSYIHFNYISEEKMRGLIGYHITFLNIPTGSLTMMEGNVEKYLYGDYGDKFKYKSMKIISVIKPNNQYVFKLEYEGKTFRYRPSYDDFIIDEGYNYFISKEIGKKFYSISSGKITSFDDIVVEIKHDTPFEVKKVEIGKVSESSLRGSHQIIYTFLHDGIEFKMTQKIDDDYIQFGYFLENDNLLEFSYILRLMTEEIYSKFSKSKFKNQIYKYKIVEGMNEFEVRLSWGNPWNTRKMTGYDKILSYKILKSTTLIYFNGDKVVKIVK